MGMINQNNRAPTAQIAPQDGKSGGYGDGDWLKRAQDAYRDSTSYVDNNYRKNWDDSIRAFNNQHPGDSKYNAPAFEKRSKLYRPKMRSIIRKNEAAAAAAFFSNMDTTSVQAMDPSNKVEVASASVMKELLQYRLTKSIPWYQIVLGGIQDAQTVGVACAHIYWEFQAAAEVKDAKVEISPLSMGSAETDDEYPKQEAADLPEDSEVIPPQLTSPAGGDPLEPPSQDEYADYGPAKVAIEAVAEVKPKVDRPVIDLFPVENLRIDPGANWMDPINSSPYVIQLIPMYIMDIKEKMEQGKWRMLGDSLIRSASDAMADSTRVARGRDREDAYSPDGKSLPDYEIVWVQRHIHRRDGEDVEFYTLSDKALLTDPRPLKETVFHGQRPYVMGHCIIETHKVMPSSLPTLGKGLVEEANEIANQRIDNVKFVLNKKWFVKRGRDVDISGLMRNVPGGAVMMEDPINDVREISWPDVTASAFEEQGRVDNDMNDLLGNFSAGQVMADKGIAGPARNMAILQQSTGTLVEYLLRTFVETFVQPVLRQVVLLEQFYETDQVILAIVAKRAQLFQKFGIDEVTDDLLEKELTLTVNVGMGATDPQMKLQKFLAGMQTYIGMVKEPVPGLNLAEIGKEIFGHMGYSDGSRFFTNDDPNIAQMQAQLQKQAKVIQDLTTKVQEKMTGHQVKLESSKILAETQIKTTQIKEDNNNMRNATTHLRAIREQDQSVAHDVAKMGLAHQHSLEKNQQQHQHSMAQAAAQPEPQQPMAAAA
jgi:hypothetical protein